MQFHTDAAAKTKPRGQMQPFSRDDVSAIRQKLAARGTRRDLALFEVAVSTLLRGSDLVRLRVSDVTNARGELADTVSVRQKKTGKAVTVPLSQTATTALAALIAEQGLTGDAYLFTSQSNSGKGLPLSTTAFRVLAKGWADLAGYTDTRRFSGHSLRRTRAAIIYRETRDIAACSKLLGHSSVAHTAAYLNVGAEEAISLSRRFEI